MSRYDLSTTPPEFVSALPRDYRDGEGKVVKEAGVIQETLDGNRYWKAFQLIETVDGDEMIRPCYYTETGGYQNKPLTLPPEILSDLTQFADGKIW